ncbi:hypothetical protein HOG16_02510 [Candidatus Woesearchaeota archaeon]|jgi:hypothetical protein|nr:hypothetical protein [Candidatus Woesearchaeota archaeon]MBT4321969.1 hypothetical protein [Candidatus Woesearchaeota archaeon]MBT4631321.1 hypothetical protein [Candidatus Woesearchaeota archaeon]
MQQQLMGRMVQMGLGAELIYAFIIIISSLMIYFGTKELYELTKYKGIKYFREAFLLFAIAFFFRSFIKSIMILFGLSRPHDFQLLGIVSLFIFLYTITLAMFYLLYSIMWKKWRKSPKIIYLFHILAILIAILSLITGNITIILLVNILLLILILSITYIAHKNPRKKGQSIHLIYVLLSLFLILNVIDILIPNFLQLYQLMIYLLSIGIFLLIFYKVLKKSGSD